MDERGGMESTNVPKRVLIFAGAGASTAVNQDKYPTTIQFYERLPKGIQGNTLFKIVVEFLSATRGSRPLDIEEVLWALREINEAIAWHPKEHPLAWMMERNALGKVFGSSDNFRVIVQRMRDLVREVKKLTDEINVQVYSLYKSSPSPSELNTTWKKVFVALRSVLNPIELVTTNYDRVLDAALRRDFISQAVVRHTREDSYGAPVLDLECWKRAIWR
jgi:hypothetical protein